MAFLFMVLSLTYVYISLLHRGSIGLPMGKITVKKEKQKNGYFSVIRDSEGKRLFSRKWSKDNKNEDTLTSYYESKIEVSKRELQPNKVTLTTDMQARIYNYIIKYKSESGVNFVTIASNHTMTTKRILANLRKWCDRYKDALETDENGEYLFEIDDLRIRKA